MLKHGIWSLPALIVLAGCSGIGGGTIADEVADGTSLRGGELARACIERVSAPGSYDIPTGVTIPTVIPGPDGTAAGAAQINACIQISANGARPDLGDVPLTPVTEVSGGLGPLPGTVPAPAPVSSTAPLSATAPLTAVAPAVIPQPAPQPAAQPVQSTLPAGTPRPAGCTGGSSVLQGGATYCVNGT